MNWIIKGSLLPVAIGLHFTLRLVLAGSFFTESASLTPASHNNSPKPEAVLSGNPSLYFNAGYTSSRPLPMYQEAQIVLP